MALVAAQHRQSWIQRGTDVRRSLGMKQYIVGWESRNSRRRGKQTRSRERTGAGGKPSSGHPKAAAITSRCVGSANMASRCGARPANTRSSVHRRAAKASWRRVDICPPRGSPERCSPGGARSAYPGNIVRAVTRSPGCAPLALRSTRATRSVRVTCRHHPAISLNGWSPPLQNDHAASTEEHCQQGIVFQVRHSITEASPCVRRSSLLL